MLIANVILILLVLQELELKIEDMSPASRSKSKDKKAGKEPQKGTSKPSGHVNTSNGTPASGYNPLLGTFHTFEAAPVPSASPLHVNGRFRNIDDTDDHNGNSSGAGVEYDSVSNNGSWSGESEDHKEKTSQPHPRQESVPGADNDKREKIRQKNERKHQRQKERRAQELHERCSGYLMSRKLEALAQQLVAMGFSQERATMALILNEGRVEESVAWLFEGGEEDKHMEHNLDSGGSLKIDISEELARITDMEIRYKASKQEVERAVVSCEGDLEKAEELLKAQKEEPPAVPSKPEETGDPPTVANSKQPIAISQNPMRIQGKSNTSTIVQQKRDEKDFNYTKVPVTIGSSVEPGAKNIQVLKKVPPKLDWTKPQQISAPAEKRWASAASNASSSFSLASPLQASPLPAKTESRYMAVGNELKNLQLGTVKNRNHSGNGLWSRGGASPALAAASSLGLFSGVGTNGTSGSSSPVDWNTGSSMLQFDYTNIDWSLDRGSLSARPNGLWTGANYSMQNNGRTYDSFAYSLGMKSAMRPVLSNGNGAPHPGLQDGVTSTDPTGGGSREWTSPFEEKDLFSLPRQFVSSPSLQISEANDDVSCGYDHRCDLLQNGIGNSQ
ncbi:UNVERIFIED_CONTAM: hypothetical protein Scaly_0431700 [Sesamum calycinum]|uniref:UBA domain-containing protein n=1 Tax=Sesamum calycinum TaxID=2727403 RepID=A0AAW2SGF6_9LAMI